MLCFGGYVTFGAYRSVCLPALRASVACKPMWRSDERKLILLWYIHFLAFPCLERLKLF